MKFEPFNKTRSYLKRELGITDALTGELISRLPEDYVVKKNWGSRITKSVTPLGIRVIKNRLDYLNRLAKKVLDYHTVYGFNPESQLFYNNRHTDNLRVRYAVIESLFELGLRESEVAYLFGKNRTTINTLKARSESMKTDKISNVVIDYVKRDFHANYQNWRII